MIEAAAVTFALSTITSVVLTATYVHFTRGWLAYASEQTLYCLAENQPRATCRRRLRQAIDGLPFARARSIHLRRFTGRWRVNVAWAVGSFQFRLVKSLDDRRLTSGGALR